MRAIVMLIALVLINGCTATMAGHPHAATSVPGNSSGGKVPPLADGPHQGLLIGAGEVTVEVFEDPLCPYCGQFDTRDGAVLHTLVAGGRVQVEYHELGMLDSDSSPPGYSARAAAALACMPDQDSFAALHEFLFSHQPREHHAGYTDAQLSALSAMPPISDAAACISTHRYAGWVAQQTSQAAARGVTSVPTILIKGKPVSGPGGGAPTPANLTAAVHAAGG